MKLFILSENEKNEILGLHKKYINEQVPPTTTTTTTTNQPTTPPSEIVPGVANDKVLELQNLLKTKFQSGIAADSKLGPKTIDSAMRALLGQEQLKPSVQTPSKVKTPSNVKTPSKVVKKPTDITDKTPSLGNDVVYNPDIKKIETGVPVFNFGNTPKPDEIGTLPRKSTEDVLKQFNTQQGQEA